MVTTELPGWRRKYSGRDGAIWSNPLLLPDMRIVGQVPQDPDDPLTLLEVVGILDFANSALIGGGATDVRAGTVELDLRKPKPASVPWRRPVVTG